MMIVLSINASIMENMGENMCMLEDDILFTNQWASMCIYYTLQYFSVIYI